MRPQLLLALPLLAGPLAAQQRAIAPAPSMLFQPAQVASDPDPIVVDGGIPQREGAFLGFLAGAGVGYLATRLNFGSLDPTCDVAGVECASTSHANTGEKLVVVAIGAVGGMFLGSHLARPRAPRPPRVEPPAAPPAPKPVDTGMKWWQGALTGGILGGVGAPMLVKAFRLDHEGDGVPAVAFAPLGALLGLVVGGGMAQAH